MQEDQTIRGREKEKELDLGKLLSVFLKKLWLILIFACVGFLSVTVYLNEFTPNLYTAYATMYVYISNPNQVNYQYTSQADLNTATRLMESYMVIIRSDKVMNAVAERLGQGYSSRLIASTISVGSVGGTEVMRISSTTTDPQLSMDICNAVAEFAPAEIIRVVNAGSVEVIDYASMPRGADDKGVTTKSLLGAVLGVALVCGVLTIMMLLDDRIDSQSVLNEEFDIPLLISIPDLKLRGPFTDVRRWRKKMVKAGLLPPKSGRRAYGKGKKRSGRRLIIREYTMPAVVEIYKMLRTNLCFAVGGEDNNALVITSAVPGESKSTVSANLSVVMAQTGQRVLLIDADMRKPSQSHLFDLGSSDKGLSTVLQGDTRFEDAVRRDVRPGLDVLSAGKSPSNPSELLGSEEMRRLLAELRAEYNIVIIDTPPVNMVYDALTLSGQVAGAVCVVRYQVSRRKEVRAALEAMRFTGMRPLGLVLTGMRGKYKKSYYYRNNYYMQNNTGYYKASPCPPPQNILHLKPAMEVESEDRRVIGAGRRSNQG